MFGNVKWWFLIEQFKTLFLVTECKTNSILLGLQEQIYESNYSYVESFVKVQKNEKFYRWCLCKDVIHKP